MSAPADITFSTGSADLQSQSFPSLARLAESLRNQGNLRIEITGHTDNTGPFQNNLRLSYNRAQAVGQFLYAGGIQADRIAIRGWPIRCRSQEMKHPPVAKPIAGLSCE
ncbi:OmpA family protein [Pseudomonas aeruginosa]|uniref:OmpA family protein n=1 Tax=Pseudomonas aeruginosa TaxID=287 RepID=UPI00215D8142|nr:OmpA family protein [Pseudomonas aeruginosa]